MRKLFALTLLVALTTISAAADNMAVTMQSLLDNGFKVVAASEVASTSENVSLLILQKDNQVYRCEAIGYNRATKFACLHIH